MRTKTLRILCAVLAAAVFSVSALAQADAKKAEDKRAPIVRETESNWKRAKTWTLAYIDAMPAEAMSFKATPQVRSFAEQMLHLAFWNFGFVEVMGGKASPYGKKQETLESREDMKTKAALRKVVEESYDTVLTSLNGLDEAKLLEVVPFFSTKMTRLGALTAALDHQTHHRGQTTVYLRLKGVTPPPEP
ncbi:MAG: DinB family protein [Acidobacteria bacterium]|nr:DinB family protein [Acidobacteriota bacterium]MBI3423105.1 DinB family protein [Acidobacteriota bacterium]